MSTKIHSGNPSRIQAPNSTRKSFQRTILTVPTVFGHIYFSAGHSHNSHFLLILPLLPTLAIRTHSASIKGVQ